jgi:hypothetical protein
MSALAPYPFVSDLKSLIDSRNANLDLPMRRMQ